MKTERIKDMVLDVIQYLDSDIHKELTLDEEGLNVVDELVDVAIPYFEEFEESINDNIAVTGDHNLLKSYEVEILLLKRAISDSLLQLDLGRESQAKEILKKYIKM